jgi:hypothetical protein
MALEAPKDNTVRYSIAVLMIILWLLGVVTAYTFGGFIHILLGIALGIVLLRVIEGPASCESQLWSNAGNG